MKKNISYSFLALGSWLLALLLFSSCKRNPKYVDVSNIKLETQTLRFDKDFYSLTKENAVEYLPMMKKKYGEFFEFFVAHPRFLGYRFALLDSSQALTDSLLKFVNVPVFKEIYSVTEKKFSDFTELENQMQEALKHVKNYFPNDSFNKFIPVLMPAIQGDHAFTYGNDIISVNLYYYLGGDCPFYSKAAVPEPQFISWRYKPEFMIADCMGSIAKFYSHQNQKGKCIDEMIYNGKLRYFASCMMPDAPDSIINGYTKKQLEFCETFEDKIFQYFIDHKLLYSTDGLEFNKFVKDAPNTSDMPGDAPGNLGSWLGYRMVSKYMKENPNVTLQQLMAMTDGQKIMEGAKYKP